MISRPTMIGALTSQVSAVAAAQFFLIRKVTKHQVSDLEENSDSQGCISKK